MRFVPELQSTEALLGISSRLLLAVQELKDILKCYVNDSLHSLKGDYTGDFIGDYYSSYYGGY